MRLSLLSAIGSWSGGTALEVAFGDGRRLRKANEPEANTHQLKQRVSTIPLIGDGALVAQRTRITGRASRTQRMSRNLLRALR